MLIRLASDLHLEWGNYSFVELGEDKDSVLVLAGDLAAWKHPVGYERTMYLMKEVSEQFRAVVMVCGNHEFYNRGDILTQRNLMRAAFNANSLSNVHLLENSSVVIDDVAFIGATLWTDYDNRNPLVMATAPNYMADYHQIMCGNRFIKPIDLLGAHNESRKYIFEETVRQHQQGNKTVIVTHHAVTEQSVHEKYKGDPYNSNFYSEMTNDIIDANPTLMIHGHVHDPFNYMVQPDVCQTRVVANPRGYVPHEDNGHDLCCQIEV